MVDRVVTLILGALDGGRWVLPVLLILIATVVLCTDGHLFWRWLRRPEGESVGQWLATNFWLLVGFILAVYVARHYPHDPW